MLNRYNPARAEQGENPLQLDSRSPKLAVEQSMYTENRFKMLTRSKPEEAKQLLKEAQEDVNIRWQLYQYMAARSVEKLNGHQANPLSNPEDVVTSNSHRF